MTEKIKKNPALKKGFTLLELLIVVAMIGILSSVMLFGMNASRNKAAANAAKQAFASLKPAIALCCGDGSKNLRTVAGNDVCSVPLNSLLPTAAQLKSTDVQYLIVADCNATSPAISAALTNNPSSACNGSNGFWTITMNSVTPPPGC